MPAIPLATVRKITGAITIFPSLMKPSPKPLERRADVRPEMADPDTSRDRGQHLHI